MNKKPMNTDTITIDKDVPLPPPRTSSTVYPFASMKVGDSFTLPVEKRHGARQAAYGFARKNPGFKFTIRRDDGNGTCRFWRIPADGQKAKKRGRRAAK